MPRPNSGSGSSAASGCISTSSIIPASGCSICRCSAIDYREWSRTALEQSRAPGGGRLAKPWQHALGLVEPTDPADEALAETLSDLFKAYLRETRSDAHALSTLPPGRFLMPGDLAGSPALTFAPLDAKAMEQVPTRLALGDDGAALRGL